VQDGPPETLAQVALHDAQSEPSRLLSLLRGGKRKSVQSNLKSSGCCWNSIQLK
jgi:hypothetical protein